MSGAALPNNESERLAALSRYSVLDTAPETSYDRITRTAKRVFDVPICLITLVDERRQFFKSKIGVEATETPRSHAFCAHGLLQEETLVVTDAIKDERFANNPLVVGAPYIRFYAGAQLKTKDGYKLGSLCVIDTVPRPTPKPEQLWVLEDLAAQTVELLEAGRGRQEINGLQCDLESIQHTLIADRKRWKRMEQMAALALDAGQMGFWEWDEDGKHGQWSERMFKTMGVPMQGAAPSVEMWLQLISHKDRADVRAQLVNLWQTSDPFTIKYRLDWTDGVERSITMMGNQHFDETGRFLGVLGVAWDSTVFDSRERAVGESEELFRGLSASCPVGIFRTDLENRVTYINPRLSEIWELPDLDAFQDWFKRIHPEDLQLLAVQQQRKAAAESAIEYRLLLPDGAIRWVSVRSSKVCDAGGVPVGIVGTVDDITARKKALTDLTAAKVAAEMANRSKDVFLTNVSHELRTPLNGILGMADLLMDTGLHPEQRQMTEIVRDSGRSLLKVVDDILDLTRVQACKLVLEEVPFDWNILLGQVITDLKPTAAKKGLTLRTEQAGDVISKFVGDADRIKQILVIYLTNALKFATSGGVIVKVLTQPLTQQDYELLVMVEDTGPGIPQEYQDKLFQPFSQVDQSATRKHMGAGLGLAIARRLAELMGGSVGVMSESRNGSTFWLRLTLTAYHESSAGGDKKQESSSGYRRVLLVEDHPDSQRVALNMLWKLGCHADVVSDGSMAIEMVRRNDYAMVFMDCQMPQMDGYSATQAIRQWEKSDHRAEVPIVALTAHAMAGDRERCFNAGMSDYLAKPIGLNALQLALERWEQGARKRTTESVIAP